MKKISFLLIFIVTTSCNSNAQVDKKQEQFPITKTEAEWKAQLTDLQFYVLRKSGTERPFSSALNKIYAEGTYVCAACETPLFESDTKFDSGTGWPSFDKPIEGIDIIEVEDNSFFMKRIEVRSQYADSHLGHLFDDGPTETGLRYCINSASLKFIHIDEMDEKGYGDFVKLLKKND